MTFWDFAASFGPWVLVAFLVFGSFSIVFFYRIAEPGKEVKLLWGFIEVTKKVTPTPTAANPPKYQEMIGQLDSDERSILVYMAERGDKAVKVLDLEAAEMSRLQIDSGYTKLRDKSLVQLRTSREFIRLSGQGAV